MLSWVAVDANTGSILADFTNIKLQGPLKHTLMRYESQAVNIPAWKPGGKGEPPVNWLEATREGAVFFVALADAEEHEARGVPLWGGMVVRRTRTAGQGVNLMLVTPEAYFDRVYVTDCGFDRWEQNHIVEWLANTFARSVDGRRGIPLRVEIVGGNGRVRRTENYKDSQDMTLLTALTNLAGLLEGPEWTVRWEWVNELQLGMVLTVSDRIGAPAPEGLNPAAQFYMPGSVNYCQLVEGYARGEGANHVMATSSGVEGARPQSPPQIINTDYRPRFEHRWSPSTSIKDTDTLTSHAQRALAAMKDGSLALTITANRRDAPVLGKTWRIGDDVGFHIEAPEFPGGLIGTARAVGWELTDTTVSPLIDITELRGNVL